MSQEVDLSVVSLSLGNREGDHQYIGDFFGKKVYIARIGTNGNIYLLKDMIKFFNDLPPGKITKSHNFIKDFDIPRVPDTLGLGGTTIYLWKGKTFKEGVLLRDISYRIPMLDGYLIKMSLEYMVTKEIISRGFLSGKKVLLTSAVDREGMALALVEGKSIGTVGDVIYGDLMYLLGIGVPIYNIKVLNFITQLLYPIAHNMSISFFYPQGEKQKERVVKWEKWQNWANCIAGDFHQMFTPLIKDLTGKIILTNTTTSKEVEELKSRGLNTLITTTPDFDGRSFGTNVIEALFVALGAKPLNINDYRNMVINLGWRAQPRFFNKIFQ
uniref:Quinate 5-dehydrogenase n=1 Tax=candidate division CPR3 bacterium TaxID=2268181 RepID=A0A7C4QX63_UNCC3